MSKLKKELASLKKQLKTVTDEITAATIKDRIIELTDKQEQYIKNGKRSRRKGSSYELSIAKKLREQYGIELRRTPQSGGFAKGKDASHFRGDIIPIDESVDFKLHIECKNATTWSLKQWLAQAEEDCPEGRTPLVIFHKPNSSVDYVTLRLEDFLDLVPQDKIATIKGDNVHEIDTVPAEPRRKRIKRKPK